MIPNNINGNLLPKKEHSTKRCQLFETNTDFKKIFIDYNDI